MIDYQDLKDQQARPCTLRFADLEQDRVDLRFADGGAPRQGMYAVTLPGWAAQEWFLVPVGRNSEGMLYEATFNRLVPAAE